MTDIDNPKAIPIISHTDGAKALEMALCYVKQQASASFINVVLFKKNGKIMQEVIELPIFRRKKKNHCFFLINFPPNGMQKLV